MSATPFALAPLALAAFLALGAPYAAHAQSTGSAGTPVEISITAQPLAQALTELARQARITLVATPALLAGKTAPAVTGRLTTRQALERLLAGSGLSADIDGTAVTIQRTAQPASDGHATLPAVTVSAQVERSAMTELTGSYTSPALTIGKMTQSIRETPQSVSVVTRQQMDDKNLTSLDQVLAQSTGVTRSQRNFGDHKFTIRGFAVDNDNYMIDGVSGTLYSSTGWLPLDTAILDRVEVLRGAGGLIVGASDPSGAVNLVRKRPRTERHFDVTASVGSWSNYRTEIDTGGPLNAEGTIRARMVAAYEDRKYFYDVTHSRQPLFYGVIDADLGRDTTLTLGVRHQQKTADGFWLFGLPRYNDGGALDVSRSTSLVQDWNRQRATVNEAFAEVEHRFDGDWRAKVSYNHTEGELDQKVAIPRGAVDRATGTGTRFYSLYFKDLKVVSDGIDANVTGSFAAFGGTHQILVGANASRQRVKNNSASLDDGTAINVFNPNHGAIPDPMRPGWSSEEDSRDRRYGIYASARLQLAEPLHMLLGARLSWLDYRASERLSASQLRDDKVDHQLTPYAGVVYDLNKQWSLYASYADTFQPQSQYRSVSGDTLKPAIGANYEAGVKGELYNGRLNVSAAVFSVRKNNIAVSDAANYGNCPGTSADAECFRNGSTLRSKGFEAEASGEILPGWQVAAGYTYVTSRNDEGGSINAETPRHLLRASTTYRLPGPWNAWTIGGGVSAQTGYSYFAGDDPEVRMGEGARAVWDLRAAYRINRHWTAALNVANLFDKRYYAMLGELRRGNYYGEPRNVTLTLRGSF
ncbi:TonB-dependent siderophore receptor [Cupriavidus basilensis]|nr:TonB-dependent receptor [Cupriavidus basilensis]